MLAAVHYVSLLVYVCVIAQAVVDLWVLRKCRRAEGSLRAALYFFLVCVLVQVGILIYLQITWLYANAGVQLSEGISLAWLAFDLFNGLVMFLYVTSIRIFLGWHTKEDFPQYDEVKYGLRS